MRGESKVYVFKDLNALVAGEEEAKEIAIKKPEPVLRRLWRKREADAHPDQRPSP